MPATLDPALEWTHYGESGISAAQWVGFTNVPDHWEWFRATLEEVRRLSALPPDWDGYGSPAILSPVIEAVVSLLGRFAGGTHRPPLPEIAPVTGGGLHLEFVLADRELEIEVLPDTSAAVLLTAGDDELELHAQASRLEVSALASWLLAESA